MSAYLYLIVVTGLGWRASKYNPVNPNETEVANKGEADITTTSSFEALQKIPGDVETRVILFNKECETMDALKDCRMKMVPFRSLKTGVPHSVNCKPVDFFENCGEDNLFDGSDS